MKQKPKYNIKTKKDITEETVLVLYDLPKVSLNHLFARMHWTKRNKLINECKWIVRSQTDKKFNLPCTVSYIFTFKSNPLDCSNCAAMIKILEDILFEDDSTNVVKSINIRSLKGIKDSVTIIIKSFETCKLIDEIL